MKELHGRAALTGDYPLDDWEQVIHVNPNGVLQGMRSQIPAMLKNGVGSSISMISILGQVGVATASAYLAVKHGVAGLTKHAAMEYAAQGIRVSGIGPAFIRTPLLTKHLTEEQLPSIAAMHPSDRQAMKAWGGCRAGALARQREGQLRDGQLLGGGWRWPDALGTASVRPMRAAGISGIRGSGGNGADSPHVPSSPPIQ